MAEFTEIRTPDMNDPWDGSRLPPGVRAFRLAMLGAAVVVGLPYLLAEVLPAGHDVQGAVAELRVWVPGDPAPFGKHFRLKGVGPSSAVAGVAGGASIVDDGDEGGPIERHLAAVEVDEDDVDAASDEDLGDVPGAGEETPDVEEPKRAVSPYARIRVPESAYEGLSTFIEDPTGAMGAFYNALADVALKKPGAKVRISHWGDSAIAADGMPSAARRLLQKTFGDGGHGFAMVAGSSPWYRRKDIVWESRGWRTEEFIRDQAADRRYGFGGVVAWGAIGARASWATVDEGVGDRASRFEVHYQRVPRGGRLQVSVDGEEVGVIDTAVEGEMEEVVQVFEVDDGPHTFEIRNVGGGRTRVYGVVVERSEGVVYDGLGVVGARDTRWLNASPEGMTWALQARAPDLYVLMYGGNQLADRLPMDRYKERLTEVVRRWRHALPEKSCLIMTPIDHGERYRGRVRTVPRQLEIMEVQREVALAEGCAFFSLFEAMGGDGAIGRWHADGLASGDLAHPTARGSVELGRIFYQALMRGLRDWVKAAATPSPD